jgi:hypothetical protein
VHQSFLAWQRARYAWIAVCVSSAAISAYLLDEPDGPPNGGTWLGYGLGTTGLVLIVWLAWFGLRRRRYGRAGNLQGLLSAHVYFGLALVVIATLHTGFQLHGNVHGLAFVLMLGVVGSGIFGAWAFLRHPKRMTVNRAGATLSRMAAELAALDERCAELALDFPDEIAALVTAAVSPTGDARAPRAAATMAAIRGVQMELGRLEGTPPAEVLALVQALTSRLAVLDRLRRDQRYRAQMLLWRAVHTPLTFGLLAALGVHVFAVFFYW